MDEIDFLTSVVSGQAGQTTHVEVEMLMECIASTQQAPADLDE